MNPIKKFESTAQQIWRSSLDETEKSTRLRALAKGIQHYIGRIPAKPANAKTQDAYVLRARGRVLKYLEMLADDVESLAAACKPAAVAPVRTVAVSSTAASAG